MGKVEKEKPQEEVLDPEAREKKRLELEAKRKKEREEEEARRKKEQQDLENQRKQAAQPIMAMGYTLQQSLKALAATGYTGSDAAVLWLLDNADASMEADEPEKPAEPPAKADAPAPAEDKAAAWTLLRVDSVLDRLRSCIPQLNSIIFFFLRG